MTHPLFLPPPPLYFMTSPLKVSASSVFLKCFLVCDPTQRMLKTQNLRLESKICFRNFLKTFLCVSDPILLLQQCFLVCAGLKKLFRMFLEIAPLYKKQNRLISRTGFLISTKRGFLLYDDSANGGLPELQELLPWFFARLKISDDFNSAGILRLFGLKLNWKLFKHRGS